jgi:endoglucanase
LLDAYSVRGTGDFLEEDFRLIAEWGFNFVRLPLCYTLWTDSAAAPMDSQQRHEPMLAKIDRAVDLGRRYGLHVNLNLHRAPGYSVNGERAEPYNLWKDARAQEAFCFQWERFAQRYRGISSTELSFNPVNEPPAPAPGVMSRQDHGRVMRAVVGAIRAQDPGRLIILDGLGWGNMPLPELADLGVGQSCRAYMPGGVTHYKAEWVPTGHFPPPVWPGGVNWDLAPWTRADLEAFYRPWADLAARGIGVHCGEGGAYCHTPHGVVLAWLRDVLEILTALNIGLALWCFRGAFGVLDSERVDVAYEDFHGRKLDRKLLALLQEF